MPDLGPTRITEQGAQKRRLLVATAAALFNEVGYHNASVEDVAAACGIRKPTVYHYFASKEEILYWIHDEFITLLINRQLDRESLNLAPSQALLEIMGEILDLIHTHNSYVRVFFEHYRELDDVHRAAIKEKRDSYEASIHAVIQAGIDDGEFRPVGVKTVTLAMAGMCNWTYQWYEPDGPMTSREIARQFWEILMRGIRA
jgi:AcrR family transcriptional regulator